MPITTIMPIEHCTVFKDAVQALINDGNWKFKNLDQLSHLSLEIELEVPRTMIDQKNEIGVCHYGPRN